MLPRTFSVSKVHLDLSVDLFAKKLEGLSEITLIRSPGQSADKIFLHSRQCRISEVSVNGIAVPLSDIHLEDFLGKIVVNANVKELKTFSAFHAGGLLASMEGELRVPIPESLVDVTELVVRVRYVLERPAGVVHFVHCQNEPELERNAFVKRGFKSVTGYAHMHTYASLCGGEGIGSCCGARCWFPCVDTLQDRFGFSCDVTVDKGLTAICVGQSEVSAVAPGKLRFSFKHSRPVAAHNVALCVGPFERTRLETLPWVSIYTLPGKLRLAKRSQRHLVDILKHMQEYLGVAFPFESYSQVFVDQEGAYVEAAPFSTVAIFSDELLRESVHVKEEHLAEGLLVRQAQCVAYNYFGAHVPIQTADDLWLVPGFAWFLSYEFLRRRVKEKVKVKGYRMVYDARELLQYAVDRIKKTKKSSERVRPHRGRAGDLMNRTLVSPSRYKFPVDTVLQDGKGADLHSVFSLRAFFVMHMLEQKVTAENFQTMLKSWLSARHSIQRSQSDRDFAAHVDTEKQGLNENEVFAKLKALAGGHEIDLDSSFVQQWLKTDTLLELRGAISYQKRQNEIEMVIKQEIPEGGRPFRGQVKVRVVEDDGVWEYEKRVVKKTHHWNFKCHSQPKRKKGGRKTIAELERLDNWEHPEKLEVPKLLKLAVGEGKKSKDIRWWRNESPVRYVEFDPDRCWLRTLQWKQNDVMALELLYDANTKTDIVGQCFTLLQLSAPYSATRDLQTARPRGNAPLMANAPMSSPNASEDDVNPLGASLRAASAIAACILDYSKPAQCRAIAVYALGKWQNAHAPSTLKANDSDPAKRWTGLELLLCALRNLFFSSLTKKLLPNDFDVAGEFLVKIAAVRALGRIRAQNGLPPKEIHSFMLELIRQNDNSVNAYHDCEYLGELLFQAAKVIGTTVRVTRQIERENAEQAELVGTDTYNERSTEQILEEYGSLEVVDHIRRFLDYDALEPSPDYTLTAKCLEALAHLEWCRVIPMKTPFYAYALYNAQVKKSDPQAASISRVYWGRRVRLAAYYCILEVYVYSHLVEGEAWFGVLKWLLDALALEPSPLLQRKVLTHILSAHARTIEDKHEALHNNASPAGVLYPLLNAYDDLMKSAAGPAAREVAVKLWSMMNETTAFDGRLRLMLHQLWRAVWGLEVPPILSEVAAEPQNLGPFKKWERSWAEDGYEDYTATPKIRPLRYSPKMPISLLAAPSGHGSKRKFSSTNVKSFKRLKIKPF